MYRDKNTLKTFGILLLTFIGLLGITYVMLLIIESDTTEFSEKQSAIFREKIDSGMETRQAIAETIKEQDPEDFL